MRESNIVTKPTMTQLVLVLVALAASVTLLAAPVSASAKATPTPKAKAAQQHKAKPKPKKKAKPAAKVLVPTMSGTSSDETPAFKPTNSYVAKYQFDCSTMGQSGNFVIMAEDANGTPVMGGPSVNRLAMSGSGTAKGSALGEPGSIHLQIMSECNWTVTVTAS